MFEVANLNMIGSYILWQNNPFLFKTNLDFLTMIFRFRCFLRNVVVLYLIIFFERIEA